MTPIPPPVAKAILAARVALMKRGIHPVKLEAAEHFLPHIPGGHYTTIFGLEVVPAPGDVSSVAGKRKHGKYEVVAYEREEIICAN